MFICNFSQALRILKYSFFCCFIFYNIYTGTLAHAQTTASGWFAPTLVDTGVAAWGCASGQASVELVLDNESEMLGGLSKVYDRWRVYLRNAAGSIVDVRTFRSSQITSGPICFYPNESSIQVDFDESSEIYPLRTPSVLPSGDLSFMVGKSYSGTINVKYKEDPVSDIEGLYPLAHKVASVPDFIVRTNALPSLSGNSVTGINSLKLYVVNIDTNESYTQVIPTSGGVGSRLISNFTDLPVDGHYFWTYHQDYNGVANFGSSSRSRFPTTGITTLGTFTLDRTAPVITNYSSPGISSAVLGSGTFQIRFTADVVDTLAGLATTSLYLLDTNDTIVGFTSVNLLETTDLSTVAFNVSVPQSTIYRYYFSVSDAAGNTATSTITDFSTPNISSLTLPTLQAQNAVNVTSESADFVSEITDTGNSLVTVRGICWSDEGDSAPYQDDFCLSATSTAGFNVGTFSFSSLLSDDLSSNVLIRYRGFAQNAAGRAYSELRSFVTLPSAFATSSEPLPPTIETSGATNITADKATLEAKINTVGGGLISYRAICWAVTEAALPVTTVGTASSSACHALSGSLPDSATLPYSFSYRFTGLPYNSNLWYRVYALNSHGLATATGQFSTLPPINDFKATFISQQKYHDDIDRNYDSYRVIFSAENISNYQPLGPTPTLNFQVTFTDPNGVIHQRTSTITATTSSPFAEREQLFLNIPYGVGLVEYTITPISPAYAEQTTPIDRTINNTYSFVAEFPDPNAILDLISTGSVATSTLPDPNLELVMPNRIIRSGEEGVISWDTNVTYAMNCEVRGPATFGNNGVITFDPSVDGAVGSASTGPLTSAQTFDISCTEPITGTVFSTTTRIDVAGRLQEN